MHEISITEKKYINSEDSSVEVSFQLTGHDWSELSQSPRWKAVENFWVRRKIQITSKIQERRQLWNIQNL